MPACFLQIFCSFLLREIPEEWSMKRVFCVIAVFRAVRSEENHFEIIAVYFRIFRKLIYHYQGNIIIRTFSFFARWIRKGKWWFWSVIVCDALNRVEGKASEVSNSWVHSELWWSSQQKRLCLTVGKIFLHFWASFLIAGRDLEVWLYFWSRQWNHWVLRMLFSCLLIKCTQFATNIAVALYWRY